MAEQPFKRGGITNAAIHEAFQRVTTVWDLFPPDDGFMARLKPTQPKSPNPEAVDPVREKRLRHDAEYVGDCALRDTQLSLV